MDLNEKIAARRKEKIIEEERVAAESKKKSEEEKIHKRQEAEAEDTLRKLATERFTSGEKSTITWLGLAGIAALFIAWPVGIAIIVFVAYHQNSLTNKYKAEILAEEKQEFHE